jgi:hypothetical protein
MAYSIRKSDGTLVTVADNAIDTNFYNPTGGSTGLGMGIQLIGRNAIDFGAANAQTFLQLTENFSSSTGSQPIGAKALQGQLWYDQLLSRLYVRVTPGIPGADSLVPNWEQIVTSGSGNAPTASQLQTARNISATGDAAWTVLFDGSANVTSGLVLSSVNGNIGSFGDSTHTPVFTVNAKGLITSVTNTLITSSGPAPGLIGGAAGDLPYQSAPSTTTFLTAVATGQVLVSGATPSWSTTPTFVGTNITGTATTLNIGGNAATATSASNITGGGVGGLPYQFAPSTTTFLPAVATGRVLVSGTTPSWSTTPTFVGTNITGTATALSIGGNAATATTATSATTATTATSATTATTATNIAGGAIGSVVYQSAASTTATLAVGTTGQILTVTGGVPTWRSATTAAGMWGYYNMAAQAVSGNINFQTASGNEVGVSGYVLGVLSVQNTGVYNVSSSVSYYTGGGFVGTLEIAIFKNGITTGFKNRALDGNNDGSRYCVSVSGLIQLTAGDNVSIRATFANGSSLDTPGFGTFTGIRLS